MKKIYLINLLFILSVFNLFSQNKFKFQTVIYDENQKVVSNKNLAIDIEILCDSPNGESIFSEQHNVTTTAQGVVYLTIGSINNLEDVNWNSNAYFIQVSVNDKLISTSSLLSVPFAINANSAKLVKNVLPENLINTDNWDKNKTDDFNKDYTSLKNKPTIISDIQRNKLNKLTVTNSFNFKELGIKIETNKNKVHFPGFGNTAGTAYQVKWKNNKDTLYFNKGVFISKLANSNGNTQIDSSLVFKYKGETQKQIGKLYYNTLGSGFLRYFNNKGEEKILGLKGVKYTSPDKYWFKGVIPEDNPQYPILMKQAENYTIVHNNDLEYWHSIAITDNVDSKKDFKNYSLILNKKNNRIRFEDTSNTASFPSTDWTMEFNDTIADKGSYFAIKEQDNLDGAFILKNKNADNIFKIDQNGNLGISKENPEEKLDILGVVKCDTLYGNAALLTNIDKSKISASYVNTQSTTIASDNNFDNKGAIVLSTNSKKAIEINNNVTIGDVTNADAELNVKGKLQANTISTTSIKTNIKFKKIKTVEPLIEKDSLDIATCNFFIFTNDSDKNFNELKNLEDNIEITFYNKSTSNVVIFNTASIYDYHYNNIVPFRSIPPNNNYITIEYSNGVWNLIDKSY